MNQGDEESGKPFNIDVGEPPDKPYNNKSQAILSKNKREPLKKYNKQIFSNDSSKEQETTSFNEYGATE